MRKSHLLCPSDRQTSSFSFFFRPFTLYTCFLTTTFATKLCRTTFKLGICIVLTAKMCPEDWRNDDVIVGHVTSSQSWIFQRPISLEQQVRFFWNLVCVLTGMCYRRKLWWRHHDVIKQFYNEFLIFCKVETLLTYLTNGMW